VTVDFVNTNYYVAGNFTAVDAITRHGLARLNSTGAVDQAFSPALNVNDYQCFLNRYGAGLPMANCDGSTLVPVLNVNDFACFTTRFGVGCP